MWQQAGNGISQRRIWGSKIAKGHESVKKLKASNSQKTQTTELVPFGEKKFYEKSHNAEKTKEGPSGIVQHPFCGKRSKKLKGAPWGFFFGKKVTMPEKLKGVNL